MTQSGPPAAPPAATEVKYEHSRDFPDLLAQLGVSLLVSTYQAGKVLVLGTWQGKLSITFHNFDQPMGMAVSLRSLAIGTRRMAWFLEPAGELAAKMEPPGRHDACFLLRNGSSPVPFIATTWPGAAANCGWSTPCSPCLYSAFRLQLRAAAGGRRSSAAWPPRIAAISMAWP